MLVATKVFYPTGPAPNDGGLSRAHIVRACEDSLRRLAVDTIDLYQTHRPDFDTPLDETLRAFDDLARAGKVRYMGSTTAPAWHLVRVADDQPAAWVHFHRQRAVPYNLLDRPHRERTCPACLRHGLALPTWSPLAMGMLAGRYRDADAPPADSRIVLRGGLYAERVHPARGGRGQPVRRAGPRGRHDPAQLALAWVKEQPGVTAPLIGPRTLAQVQNMLPVLDMTLGEELRAQCDALAAPGSVTASFFNSAAMDEVADRLNLG